MIFEPLPRPLTKEVAKELRDQWLSLVLDGIKQVIETDEGYQLDFGRQSEDIQLLTQFLEIERKCNPFLRMQLTLESNDGPIRVEASGPVGTKDFLCSEYGLNRWIER